MKQSTLPAIAGIFLLFLPLMCHAQDPVDVSEEIMAANDSFMKAIKAEDVKTLVSLYTEEARVMPPNLPVVEGKENIVQMWEASFEMGSMHLQLKTISAEAFGATAIEEGKYKVLSPDGQVLDTGKYIVIWKKVGGKWLLHQDIFNTSQTQAGQ
jgi:uncharacterized protein (TIGR02246 family)